MCEECVGNCNFAFSEPAKEEIKQNGKHWYLTPRDIPEKIKNYYMKKPPMGNCNSCKPAINY